jgi:hypothetical protein
MNGAFFSGVIRKVAGPTIFRGKAWRLVVDDETFSLEKLEDSSELNDFPLKVSLHEGVLIP